MHPPTSFQRKRYPAVALATLPLLLFGFSATAIFAHGGSDERAADLRLQTDGGYLRLRATLDEEPNDLTCALKLSHLCLEAGSPARARKVLAPWWDNPLASGELVLLRATILQRDHDFDAALEQLDLLLAQDPKHAEAWLMKSTIHAVCGDYDRAYASSLPLFGIASPVVAATAAANALSFSGKAAESYALLKARLGGEIGESPAVTAWAFTTLAEIAVRLGLDGEAGEHFEAALSAQPDNHYTRATYGDFLVEHGDTRRAWKLLRDSVEGEAEKLVLALIEKSSARENSKFATELADAYADGQAKSRAAARYYLDIADEPEQAWQVAKSNWDAKQREPADTLLALRAAEAAGQDAAYIVQWALERKLEDVRLVPFLRG